MGMLSRTMKKGKKMFGSLCCIDDGKLKPAPEDEKKRKNAQDKSDQNVKNKKRRLPKLFICHDKKPADDDENLTSDQKQQEGDGEKWRRKKKRKRKLVPEAFSPNKKLPPKDETKASSVVAVREGEKRNKKRRRRRLPNVLSRNKKLPKDEISKVSENAPLEYQEQKRKKRRKLVKLFHRNKNKRSEDNLAKTNRQEKDENVKERKMKKIDKKDEDVIVPKDSQEEDEKKNKNNNNSKKSKRRIKASKNGDMASKDSEEEKKHKKKRKRKVLFRKKKTPKDSDTSSKDSEEKEKKHKRKRNILFRKKKAPKDGDTLSKDSEEKEKKSKKKRKRNVLFRKKKTPKDESVAPNDSQKDEKKKKKSNKTSTDENKTLRNAHEDKKEKKKKKRRWRRRKMVKIFSKSKKLPKGEKETSRETKRKRKMKIRFWRKKKQTNKTSHLSSLISRMSSISGDNAQQTSAAEILRLGNTSIRARVFSLRELAAATRNFHSDNLLGEGGFGKVFKGQLKDTNETVAVKQLDKNGYQGNKEFLVEVLMLSLLHHPNLVRLVGYCAEGAERILVYEYMPLGSLEDHLLEISPKSRPLDWQTRMKIAAGAARGIEHLHDDTNPPVIYRDLKASNILLDEDFNPKLADFGLAKVGPTGDKTHVSTRVMGTYGYCAPEYALTGQLTKMSDVYSFGVVLLEIITGRRAVDTTKPKKEQILVHWAEPMFKDKRKFDMADPLLEGRYPVKGLCQALAVAAMCLQHEAAIRPLIRDIVTALDYLANPNYETLTGSRESIPRTLPPACSSQAAAAEDTVRTSDDMLVSESTTYPESFSSGYQESDDGIVINLPYPP